MLKIFVIYIYLQQREQHREFVSEKGAREGMVEVSKKGGGNKEEWEEGGRREGRMEGREKRREWRKKGRVQAELREEEQQ